MEQAEYALARPVCLSLPAEEIDRLLREKDGACALVYLALQRAGGRAVTAESLGLTEQALRGAMAKLERLGLVAARKSAPLPPADELPQYTAEDLVRRSKEDAAFQGVRLETERLYGRKLTTPETRTLLGMYDYLGFPADVLMELVNHVFEEFRAENGPGRVPTMRMIEKEAYIWAQHEVLTLELAEAYIGRRQQRREHTALILETVQVRGRAPTPTERKYIESWLDMGFSDGAIAEAYDRTVVSTGGLKWPYLNKILVNWHQKGLHTPEQIAQGDPRGGARRTAPVQAGGAPRNDLARAEQMLREMKQKRKKE